MTTQTESPIKHHPDDWSYTSEHHHHVERTVHPVIVELVKWVCLFNLLALILHFTFGRQAAGNLHPYNYFLSAQRG